MPIQAGPDFTVHGTWKYDSVSVGLCLMDIYSCLVFMIAFSVKILIVVLCKEQQVKK